MLLKEIINIRTISLYSMFILLYAKCNKFNLRIQVGSFHKFTVLISLSSPIYDNIKFILDCIIGNEYAIFDKNLSHYFSPIISFEKRNPIDRKKIMENSYIEAKKNKEEKAKDNYN